MLHCSVILVTVPDCRLQMGQVVVIAKAAVDRLSGKLTALKGTGRPVDMAEELRMLTLQVIGEAILSLPPEECDKASMKCFPGPAGHKSRWTISPAVCSAKMRQLPVKEQRANLGFANALQHLPIEFYVLQHL